MSNEQNRQHKPRNADRKAKLHARNFGEEAERVRRMPCLVAVVQGVSWYSERGECSGQLAAAHVTARAMGGSKGGRFDLVPLCAHHHDEAGEAKTSKRIAFEARHGLDLRAEADRIALEHPEPLGIRDLAARWACGETPGGCGALPPECQGPLDAYESDALLGWVRRRMAREVDRREVRRCWPDHVEPGCQWDGLADDDREALAHAVAHDLGGDFTTDPHGEHGLAWTLCEASGWP